MLLSDSLLRPILQDLITTPRNYLVNCSPGAVFRDLTAEIKGIGIPSSVRSIYIVCGTNYMGKSDSLVVRECRVLIETLLERSPAGTVVITFFLLSDL